MSNSVRPHRWQPTRLPHPWDSPGKNTGVGCYFLLQCMKVKSESEVAQSCPTLLQEKRRGKAFASQSTQSQSQKRTDHTTSGPLALHVMRCYCPQQEGECGLRSQLGLTNSDLSESYFPQKGDDYSPRAIVTIKEDGACKTLGMGLSHSKCSINVYCGYYHGKEDV